jgi:hypothetical protein
MFPGSGSLGIGDGGNEIGMGKIRWEIIRRNIPRGGLVACRVPVDHLIVCGVSNWGAYGLAAGVLLLRGQPCKAGYSSRSRSGTSWRSWWSRDWWWTGSVGGRRRRWTGWRSTATSSRSEGCGGAARAETLVPGVWDE